MEAFTQARVRQKEARRLCEQKCDEALEAGTMFNGAMKDTLEKAEALEKYAETVTLRELSLWRPRKQTSSVRSSTATKKPGGI